MMTTAMSKMYRGDPAGFARKGGQIETRYEGWQNGGSFFSICPVQVVQAFHLQSRTVNIATSIENSIYQSALEMRWSVNTVSVHFSVALLASVIMRKLLLRYGWVN
jgi:hypothetical protein